MVEGGIDGNPPGPAAGVGAFRTPRFLADGDRVRVEIERIGVLENICRVESTAGTAA